MKGTVVIGVVILLALLLFGIGGCGYNRMVKMEESVTSQWAQVENAYQRRADLIPNLVNTVKGAADFEQQTLTAVIEARSRATSVRIDPTNLNESNIQQFQEAQAGLSSALSRLLVTVEAYPDLKANQNFRALMDELSGTENRISTERNRFNTVVKEYNSSIRSFPNNLMAGMFGFSPKGYFESREGSDVPPPVDFSK